MFSFDLARPNKSTQMFENCQNMGVFSLFSISPMTAELKLLSMQV